MELCTSSEFSLQLSALLLPSSSHWTIASSRLCVLSYMHNLGFGQEPTWKSYANFWNLFSSNSSLDSTSSNSSCLIPRPKLRSVSSTQKEQYSLLRLHLPCCSLEIVSSRKRWKAKLTWRVSFLKDLSLMLSVAQCLRTVVSYIVPTIFIIYGRKTITPARYSPYF